jgi:hypothetical protein
LTTKEISIFGNSSHFEWRAVLLDTILKRDHPTTIPAKFALIWFSGFREEDLNVIKICLIGINQLTSDWLKFQRSSSPILHGGWNWKLS